MAYNKQTWVDGAAGNTPINAARLNAMENGIAAGQPGTQESFLAANGNDANDGLSWATAKATFAAALSLLPRTGSNQGGTVNVGPGTFTATAMQDFVLGTNAPNNVKIKGSGRGTTTFSRSGDFAWARFSGIIAQASNPNDNPHLSNWTWEDVQFEISGHRSSFMWMYACASWRFNRCQWIGGGGTQLEIVETWDSSFADCRFDGSYDNELGTRPAVLIRNGIEGTVMGQFGYSADSSNNIYFTRCWWETNLGGSLHVRQGLNTGRAPHRIRLVQCKFETNNMRNHVLWFANTNFSSITDVSFTAGQSDINPATKTNVVFLDGCSGVTLSGIGFEFAWGTGQPANYGLLLKDTQSASVHNVYGSHGGGLEKPILGLVGWTGTNTKASVGGYDWYWSGGGAAQPVVVGAPTSYATQANKVVGTGINSIVKITQTAYDALSTKDANTLYVIGA